MAYLAADYCQEDIVKYAVGYDFVILNCGHRAAKNPEFSYKLFKSTVDALSGKLGALSKQTQLFWVENSAEPFHKDEVYDGFGHHDKKTYHRLLLFDALARGSLKRFKIPFSTVTAFSSTLPLYDKMCDCLHYPKSAKMPQLLELLSLMKKPALS